MAKGKKSAADTETAPREHWKGDPDEQDFPAALDYLSLLLPASASEALVKELEKAPLSHRKAKDLLRASSPELLPPENSHVAKDLEKARRGELLSPVLLVRGQLHERAPLTIADGYHRVCASYHLDEEADIPCRIVDLGT
ncbi:MAG: hypothetical protein ACRDV4_06620 [Acidimicrobiales bacterium]